MAGRIRSIKPELLEDERAATLSDAAWRLWVSSWLLADDFGNLRMGDRYIAAQVWQDTSRNVAESIREVTEAGFIDPYAVRGQRYGHVNNWEKHQRVDNAGKARVPTPEEDDGTWNQSLSVKVAESSGRLPNDSETVGDPPLARRGRAQSGRQTNDPDPDQRPPIVSPPRAAGGADGPTSAIEQARGTRIQSDWKPKDETVRWAAQQGVDAMACVEEFIEYWQTIPGVKGRRANWDLTLRGRIRRLVETGRAPRLPDPPAAPPQPAPDALGPEAAREHLSKLQQTLLGAGTPPWQAKP